MIGRKIKFKKRDETLYYDGIVVDKVLIRQYNQGFETYPSFAVTAYLVSVGPEAKIVFPNEVTSIEE